MQPRATASGVAFRQRTVTATTNATAMKVEFVAHPEQRMHGDQHLSPNEVDWPDGVPVPAVGDRLYLYGAEVEIVERLFAYDPSSRTGEHGPIVLTWVDVRYGLDGTGRFPEKTRPPGGVRPADAKP